MLEPVLRLRSWRQFNDPPTGPCLWSLAQQEAFIRQIFKIKYNGVSAVEAGERALSAAAAQVRDDSDRSSLAAYYHFFVREVREKSAELLAGREGVAAPGDPMQAGGAAATPD